MSFRLPPSLKKDWSPSPERLERWIVPATGNEHAFVAAFSAAIADSAGTPTPTGFRLAPDISGKHGHHQWRERLENDSLTFDTYEQRGRETQGQFVAIAKFPLSSDKWLELIFTGPGVNEQRALIALARSIRKLGPSYPGP